MLITQPNTQLTTHHTSPFQLDSRTNFSIQRGILLHSKKTQYIPIKLCIFFTLCFHQSKTTSYICRQVWNTIDTIHVCWNIHFKVCTNSQWCWISGGKRHFLNPFESEQTGFTRWRSFIPLLLPWFNLLGIKNILRQHLIIKRRDTQFKWDQLLIQYPATGDTVVGNEVAFKDIFHLLSFQSQKVENGTSEITS